MNMDWTILRHGDRVYRWMKEPLTVKQVQTTYVIVETDEGVSLKVDATELEFLNKERKEK